MASAQTEPSMDEILASIRRIISEEDDAPQEMPVRQKLEKLQLRDEQQAADDEDAPEAQAEAPKPRLRAKKPDPAPEPPAPEPEVDFGDEAPEAVADAAEPGAPEAEGGSDHVSEADAQDAARGDASDGLDDFEPLPEDPVAASSTMEPAAEAHDAGAVQDDTFDAARAYAGPADTIEAPRSTPTTRAIADAVRPAVAASAMASLSVSDEAAGQAASAFGALEENMRLSQGSGRTIEDMIESMLTPMLKAWLDENLPRIVEDKVEEEVRRISRRR